MNLISHQVVETPYKFHSLQSDDIFHRSKRIFHPCLRFRRWNKKVSHRKSWDHFEWNSWQFCNLCDWKIPWAGPWKEYFEFFILKKLKNSDHWKISIQENSDCRPDELVEIGQYVTRCRVLWEWFQKMWNSNFCIFEIMKIIFLFARMSNHFWLLNEGLFLLERLVLNVFEPSNSGILRKWQTYAVIGWLVPFVYISSCIWVLAKDNGTKIL